MGLSKSAIDYLTHVANPFVGCPRGCPYCGLDGLLARVGRNIGCDYCLRKEPHVHPERLRIPGGKAKRIGVGFQTDICGDWTWAVPDSKERWGTQKVQSLINDMVWEHPEHRFVLGPTRSPENIHHQIPWPSNCVWLITCTNQEEAIWNLPVALERIKGEARVAANLEPLTEATDLRLVLDGPAPFVLSALDWVIVGGLSGPLATPMHPDCVRGLRDQCLEAGVPFYFKQWGAYAPVRGIGQWPSIAYKSMPSTGCRTGDVLVHPDGSLRDFVSCCTDAPCSGRERGMRRVGKREAGHVLDGREWRQMPEALLLPGEGPAQTPR